MSIMDKIALICNAPQMKEPSYLAIPKTETGNARVDDKLIFNSLL